MISTCNSGGRVVKAREEGISKMVHCIKHVPDKKREDSQQGTEPIWFQQPIRPEIELPQFSPEPFIDSDSEAVAKPVYAIWRMPMVEDVVANVSQFKKDLLSGHVEIDQRRRQKVLPRQVFLALLLNPGKRVA